MSKPIDRWKGTALAVVLVAGCSDNSSSISPADGGVVITTDGGGDAVAVADGSSADGAVAPDGATTDGAATDGAAANLAVSFTFNNQMPTGVAISREGRIFTAYPHWEDPITYTVAELVNGTETPYPDMATNTPSDPEKLLSVQSVVIDPANRLWLLDTGSINEGPVMGQFPKLVGIDLSTNHVFKTIHFPADVVLPTTYLNDVRFDLAHGSGGTAFITDSSSMGENAIIVVDLASGNSRRVLRNDPSTKSDPGFQATVLGQPVMVQQTPEMPPMAFTGNIDGIAITSDRLFYTPLTSHFLYSVSLATLEDAGRSDADIAATIQKEQRSFASDGLYSDAQGHVYLTDWEHNAVWERTAANQFVMLAQDTARMFWPDSFALGSDGSLYVTANQLQRRPRFHAGMDQRVKPFYLFKISTEGKPITAPAPGMATSR
jgi:sugar lactone lactonase YvrE